LKEEKKEKKEQEEKEEREPCKPAELLYSCFYTFRIIMVECLMFIGIGYNNLKTAHKRIIKQVRDRTGVAQHF